jgi:FAD/FMN-containing dehydrogenase
VTFAQLKQEAAKHDLKPLMPLMPRATKSVLASYLEREPITTPRYHWDMTDPILCSELVFGTGDLMRTGSAAGPGTLEQQWDREIQQKNPTGGPGAINFVQLFQASQGTMGIATWASIKLEMMPRARALHFVPEASLAKLIEFSYRMLRLKLGDEFLILSGFALANLLADDPAEIRALAEKQSPYVLVYCTAGYQHFPEKRVEYQEHDIAGVAQQYAVLPKSEVPGAGAVRMLEILDNPSPDPYWKLRFKGGFREISFLTTMDRTPAFIELMENQAAGSGYPAEEIAVYLQPVQQGRSCHLEFNLLYDPSDAKETARAGKLFDEASRALRDAGAFFSRPYGPIAEIAYAGCPDTVETLRKVKAMFDPNHVMNRGRLCFEEV